MTAATTQRSAAEGALMGVTAATSVTGAAGVPGAAAAAALVQGHGEDAAVRQAPSVGIVIRLPEPLASQIMTWRLSFGDLMARTVPAHVTLVTTTPAQDWDATVAHVRQVASEQQPFTVHLKGTETFRPISPVVYLKLDQGYQDCVALHQKLQQGPLARDLAFPYHPHITVAHEVTEAAMDKAQRSLADIEATFSVDSMGLYIHDNSGVWQLQEELSFGGGTGQAGAPGTH